MAVLLHLAANPWHLLAGNGVGMLQLVVAALAATMLVRPLPVVAGALAGGFALVLWLKLPVVGNHEIILGLFSLAILVSVLSGGARWPDRVAPAGRWILLLSYGFIALSKLNHGFLDAVQSCAVVFADEFGLPLGVRPGDSTVVSMVIILATVVIEAVIPPLLVWRRTRPTAVVLALGFHFVLALDPASHVWDFSSALLPLFLLFTEPSFRHRLDRRLAALDRLPGDRRALMVALVICGGAMVLVGSDDWGVPSWLVAYPVWLAFGGTVLAAVVHDRFRHGRAADHSEQTEQSEQTERQPLFRLAGPRPARVAVVAVLVIAGLNGISPYLEVRTAAAFNMYSNLRVIDGESNHLFIGSLRQDGPQSFVQLVSVEDGSPLGYYIDRDLLVPGDSLDRYLRENNHEDPTVLVDDMATSARAVGFGAPISNGVLARIGDQISRKVMVRRAVGVQSEQGCLRAWGPIG